MKFLILMMAIWTGSVSHAALSFQTDDTGPALKRTKEFVSQTKLEELNRELLKNLYEIEMADMGSSSIAKVNGMLNFAGKCESFATVKDMGQWGELILGELKRNRYTELYRGAPDLQAICPNFNSSDLGDDGREVVWVMVVNAMAHLESSCTMGIPAKGPNGALIGLLQLHNGSEQKYAKYCKKGDGKTAEGTFRCGLSMLEGQLSRDNSLFSRKSYWDVLRPQAKGQKYLKIKKALSNLSICKTNALPFATEGLKNVPIPIPRPSDISTAPTEESPTTEPTPAPTVEVPPVEQPDVTTANETPSIEDIINGAGDLGKSADSLGAQVAE